MSLNRSIDGITPITPLATGSVVSDLTPGLTDTFNLGTSSQEWNNLYCKTANIVSPVVSGATANTGVIFNSSKALTSVAQTNGQIIVGATAGAPAAAGITGTASQITVTNGANSITLSTPQNIATTSTPTFASETLTATTNQVVLGAPSHTTIINATAPAAASQTVTIPDTAGASSFMMTAGNQTASGINTFSNSTDASTTATGSIITAGGIGCAKKIYVGSDIIMTSLSGFKIGNIGGVNGNAGIINSGLVYNGTNYSLFQIASGATLLNSAVGTPIYLSVGDDQAIFYDGTSFNIIKTTNQLTLGAPSHTTIISATAPAAASQTVTIPDTAGASSFMMTAGAQSASGVNTFSNATDSTTTTTGAVIISGGLGVAKTISCNGVRNSNYITMVGPTQQTFTANTNTNVEWNTAVKVSAGITVGGTNNSIFTVAVAGIYQICGTMLFTNGGTNYMWIINSYDSSQGGYTFGAGVPLTSSCIIYLPANATFNFVLYSPGTTTFVTAGNLMGASLLSVV